MLKLFLHRLLSLLFRIKVIGLENYHNAGDRVLIVSNHCSYLDPLLLGVFLPDEITFAINTHISQRWWLKPFLGLSKVFPMDSTHPMSLKALIQHLQTDTRVVIFPEGRISSTGSLMKIYDGPAMVADKTGAIILPIRIDGAEYSHFSRLQGRLVYAGCLKSLFTFCRQLRFTVKSRRRERYAVKIVGKFWKTL